MSRFITNTSLILVLLAAVFYFHCADNSSNKSSDQVYNPLGKKGTPNQSFLYQRTYPNNSFPLEVFEEKLAEIKYNSTNTKRGPINFDANWTLQGPGNLGGRVNTIAIHPTNENTILIGFSNGGIWKTVDAGLNWYPVFDDQLFLSIGDILFDISNPEIIYAATGDPNMGSMPFVGDGVYKSEDGGESWAYAGLKQGRIISKLSQHVLDPATKVIYASVLGLPFEKDDHRGLYKSYDNGESWSKSLFLSDSTGVIDHVVDHENPNIVYAAAWDHIRNNKESILEGENSGIYKTTDGGESWERLRSGLPSLEMSRIGLTMSSTDPNIIYAAITAKVDETVCIKEGYQLHSIVKTTNGGEDWFEIDTDEESTGLPCNAMGSFGWYFGKIALNPENDNELYLLGVDLWKTTNDGDSWERATTPWWQEGDVHVDMHELVFSPIDNNLFLGTDGGAYKSENNGLNWKDIENIPTVQFYRVAHNPNKSHLYYGGTQDNGTVIGNQEVKNHWQKIFGGDGFKTAFHPENANIFIVETQFGGLNITANLGATFQTILNGIEPTDKRNWDMPYIFSNGYSNTLYLGTDKIYKGEIINPPLNVVWEPLSEDLTKFQAGDNPQFHNITSISESSINRSLLYAGTSDGNVVRSVDTGNRWENITGDLPDHYITSIQASPSLQLQDYVYVSHSGYRENKPLSHIHRSKDRGNTWESIASNLPEIAINDVYILDNNLDSVLFVATDGGVYASLNQGILWKRLGANMPVIPVMDLEYNANENKLIAGTFGRSLMTFELDSLGVSGDFSTGPPSSPPPVKEYVNINPSPATNFINVKFSNLDQDREIEIAIVSANGQLIDKRAGHFGRIVKEEFDISRLSQGVYFVAVKMRHQTYSSRFVKISQ